MNIESLFNGSFNKFCFLTSSLLRLGMCARQSLASVC